MMMQGWKLGTKAFVVVLAVMTLTTPSTYAARLGRPQANAGTSVVPFAAGQSRTLLPDGRILALGGEGTDGVSGDAYFEDAKSAARKAVSAKLHHPRAFHSSTVLPNGKVLIFGGMSGVGKEIVAMSEIFDPRDQTFTEVSTVGLTLRKEHTATLLTDGRVMFAGGRDEQGRVLGKIEIWDPKAGQISVLSTSLGTPTYGQTARLTQEGTVILSGGISASEESINYQQIVNVVGESVRLVTSPSQSQTDHSAFRIAASIPQSGETGIPVNQLLAVRFSEPVDYLSLTSDRLSLRTGQTKVPVNLVAAEDGMLAFLNPTLTLQAGTVYTLVVHGLANREGTNIADTALVFTTAPLVEPAEQAATPSGWYQDGNASANAANAFESSWRKLPMHTARNGVTALAGQVLKLDGNPLSNVSVEIGSHHTLTDESGRFLLDDVGPGHHVMLVDGAPATENGHSYGIYRVGVDLKGGQTNNLNYTIWMTALDNDHVVNIPSPTAQDVVITNPNVPGVEIHIPAGTVIRDARGRVVTKIGITPIPPKQPPFPLKKGVVFPVYFTIQPGGASFLREDNEAPQSGQGRAGSRRSGATIHYENRYAAKPGTQFAFWNYDPAQKGWYVYGHGKVSGDSKMIRPNEGTQIWSFDGAMVSLPQNGYPSSPRGPMGGDPVDLQTGLFVYKNTDLYLKDVIPISLARAYRQSDYQSRSFGVGTNMTFDMFLVGDASGTPEGYTYQDLFLADGSRIHFTRTSACFSSNGYCDYMNAVYTATSQPGPFYGATLTYYGATNGWIVATKDGSVLNFPDSSNATDWRQAALSGYRDRNGNTITLTRDAGSNLTRITSPNGRWIQLTYDASNRVVSAQDNVNRSTSYTYNPAGYLSTATDANGGVTTFSYDGSGNMTSITDPRNIQYVQNQYDVNDMIARQTNVDGGYYQFSYTVDSNGNVTQTNVTDPRGFIDVINFNGDGYMSSKTLASGQAEHQTITYNRQEGTGLVLSRTDQLARTTSYSYDGVGNVTSMTQLASTPNAVTSSFTYNNFSEIVSVTDPMGNTAMATFDQHGSATSKRDPLGNTVSYTANPAGQLTSLTDPLGNRTSLSYKGGDLVSVTDALSRTSSRSIDGAGRITAIVDPLGNTTRFVYDSLDHLTQITDALGGQTVLTYDPDGNLTNRRDANGNVTILGYDSMNRAESKEDPLHHTLSLQFDLDGNVSQITDRKGQVTTLSYDGLNRNIFVGYGTSAGPAYQSTITKSFDGANRLYSLVDSLNGTITRSFDGLDALLSEATPQGSVSYTYDADERRKTLTVPGLSAANYTYDVAGRLLSISQGTSTVGFAYDRSGRRTSTTLPNGSSSSYVYDGASQLTGINYQGVGSAPSNITYAYDLAGRRVGESGNLATTQLPVAIPSATYNANDQLTQWGSAPLSYDLNGNVLADGTHSYTWNVRNQLASLDSGSVSFSYDALGRRRAKSLPAGNTAFLYDGANAVQELSGSTPIANVLAAGVDERFTRTDSNGTANYIQDGLGSTLALIDNTGTSVNQYSYDPYGNATVTGPSTANSYTYTGRENDGTGLLYYRARYYNPGMGRFISEDPTGSGIATSAYDYAHSNPISFGDSFGERTFQIGIGGTAVGGGAGVLGGLGFVFDGEGNVGFYDTYGAGLNGEFGAGGVPNVAVGDGASGGVQMEWTNADSINDLEGYSMNASLAAGDGFGGSLDGAMNFYPADEHWVGGGGMTLGAGAGAGFFGGVTYTHVRPIVCGREKQILQLGAIYYEGSALSLLPAALFLLLL